METVLSKDEEGWAHAIALDVYDGRQTMAMGLIEYNAMIDRGLTAVVVQPEDSPDTAVTPKGRRGVFCPAQRDGGQTTCFGGKGTRACGGGTPLCGRLSREWFVIFKAHGVRKNALNERFATGQLAKAA